MVINVIIMVIMYVCGYAVTVQYTKKMSCEQIRLPGRSITSNFSHFFVLARLQILSTGSYKIIT